MNSIELTGRAVRVLCMLSQFPRLKPEIKAELEADGFDATILFISNGSVHIQFQSAEQAVMFKLKYNDMMVGNV